MSHILYFLVVFATTLLVGSCGGSSSGGSGNSQRNTVADYDGDGLFEISNIAELNSIRYNLTGTSYKSSIADEGITTGCPEIGCNGYEIMNDISMPRTWDPIGDVENPFTATLEGNLNTLKNLKIDSNSDYVGFFAFVMGDIRNLSFKRGSIYSSLEDGTSAYPNHVGVLAGMLGAGSTVYNVFSDLSVSAASGSYDIVGALVGENYGAMKYAYSIGNVDSSNGNYDKVGGLVGRNNGSIRNSYASGKVRSGVGILFAVGGLVGENNGIIQNSRAIGGVRAGISPQTHHGYSGGLVGINSKYIRNSYATGNINGSSGVDYLGGLVGSSSGRITNSYATGMVDGGASGDYVGALVGSNAGYGKIYNSYAIGSVEGNEGSDKVGLLVGFRGSLSSVDMSYYFTGSTLSHDPADTVLMYDISKVKGKNDDELRYLDTNMIIRDFGYAWSAVDWDFTTGFYPSVRSSVSSILICSQPAETHKQC